MRKFGFTVQHDNTIDIDKNGSYMHKLLLSREPSANLCIGCGSCTATCSSGHYTSFNIRLLHTLLRRGETPQLKKEISKCMFCGKCQLVCPRGVNLRNLIMAIHHIIDTRHGQL